MPHGLEEVIYKGQMVFAAKVPKPLLPEIQDGLLNKHDLDDLDGILGILDEEKRLEASQPKHIYSVFSNPDRQSPVSALIIISPDAELKENGYPIIAFVSRVNKIEHAPDQQQRKEAAELADRYKKGPITPEILKEGYEFKATGRNADEDLKFHMSLCGVAINNDRYTDSSVIPMGETGNEYKETNLFLEKDGFRFGIFPIKTPDMNIWRTKPVFSTNVEVNTAMSLIVSGAFERRPEYVRTDDELQKLHEKMQKLAELNNPRKGQTK